MEPITTPAYRLAERVWKNELTFEKALEQVVSPSNLAQVNTTVINDLDRFIRDSVWQDLKQAIVLAILNREVALNKGNTAVKGKCSNTLAWLYLRQDESERALHYYQEALNLLENVPQAQAAIARIRLDIGEINERQGNWDAARLEYQAALASTQELRQPTLESDAHNGLGRIHLALEQTDEALAAFRRALEISQQNDDQRGEETALGNLGLVYHFLGQLQQAASCLQQSLDISREIKHTAGTGRHLNHLGNVLLDLGDLDKAEECLLEALGIARQMNDRLGEQQRSGNLGNLYRDLAKRETVMDQRKARLGEAHAYHQQALTLARERNDQSHQCDHLLNLGNVQRDLGQLEAAQKTYREALRLTRKHNALDARWRIHFALGNLCDEQKHNRLARCHYQKAIDIVERQRTSLHIIESRMKFWQERSLLYKRMMLCCLRLNDLWAALEYTERAKARYLADLLSQRTPAIEYTQAVIRAVLQALPEHTAVVTLSVTEAGTVVFIATDQPSEEMKGSGDLGWQLSPDGQIRAELIQEFNQASLERLLVQRDETGQPSGGYLVEYYAHRLEIEKWKPTLEAVCATLGRSLWMPIHQQLQLLRIERLVLMPNLGLSVLPLHAGNLGQDKPDYVLDHYEITYAPSFKVLQHCQSQPCHTATAGASLLAIANPTGDLPWAEFEVEQIAPWFQAHILDSGSANPATRDAVLAQALQTAVLHFACHGSFDLRDPLQSALMLKSPDVLTLAHILRDDRRLGARLVVMSACETGLVDPGDLADESIGLPAGFLQAGVPNVVSSLWAVDDISTALLMIRFYQYYLQGDAARGGEPMRAGLALRRAQEWLRNELRLEQVAAYISRQEGKFKAEHKNIFLGKLIKAKRKLIDDNHIYPFADPYYWAAFTVLGDV